MKTAQEWMGQLTGTEATALVVVNQMTIREIQLDAMKEGARRAAQIAEGTTFAPGKRNEWESAYDKGCLDSEEAILAAAEQWTINDL